MERVLNALCGLLPKELPKDRVTLFADSYREKYKTLSVEAIQEIKAENTSEDAALVLAELLYKYYENFAKALPSKGFRNFSALEKRRMKIPIDQYMTVQIRYILQSPLNFLLSVPYCDSPLLILR